MPDTTNIAEECSLLSLNDTDSSHEQSCKKNPPEKLEKPPQSMDSYRAQIKKDKIS